MKKLLPLMKRLLLKIKTLNNISIRKVQEEY